MAAKKTEAKASTQDAYTDTLVGRFFFDPRVDAPFKQGRIVGRVTEQIYLTEPATNRGRYQRLVSVSSLANCTLFETEEDLPSE